VRGDSTAVTDGLLRRSRDSLILCTVVDKDLKRIIKIALESMPSAPSVKVAEFILTERRALIRDWLTARIETERERKNAVSGARKGRRGRPDSRQTWLPLPEFPHIPPEAQGDSWEEYHERMSDLQMTIKSHRRQSSEKLTLLKRQLTEMRQLERKVAPLFADDPSLTTIGKAIVLLREG
jgi:hypothetical protein